MAQEPLRELTDNLLSIFKEAVASEYQEQNQRIDSLEMKVNKICTFILESQKLINSIFAVEENKVPGVVGIPDNGVTGEVPGLGILPDTPGWIETCGICHCGCHNSQQ